ncbi:glycosyltransferase family 4 protein [Alicyclobacillus contaminans]|uniref:glycosyltransferase family 4 protein n=1 Tax=Alicyclobacillus contaminans TaxID=392016 RepID=UPI00040B1464|nr:glycosyltransferase family 4 protein [Alicyclobacillus contaminans]
MTRRILMVTYAFPPMGGIAVQRPLKFVQHLPRFGWEPMVLTTKDAYSATMDESLLQAVPAGTRIERIANPLSRLQRASVQWNGDAPSANAAAGMPPRHGPRAWLRGGLKALKSALLIPDEYVWWAISAARHARSLVQYAGIDCVYTTSGPNSTHLVGLLLKQWTGVTWIADFRDPWVGNLHYHHRGLTDAVHRWMERKVMQRADVLMTVTEAFRDQFVETYPHTREKWQVIRNGADPMDFPAVQRSADDAAPGQRPLTIFYAGILYERRSPEPFLRALAQAIADGRLSKADIRVEFAGIFDYPGKRANAELVEQLQLQGLVHVHGYLPRTETLKRMQTADVLLLIGDTGPRSSDYVPGKLYEYLFANRPMLALVEEGEAANLVRQTRAGWVLPPQQVNAMADLLVSLVHAHRAGGVQYAPNREEQQKYSRVEQTRCFAECLNTTASACGWHSAVLPLE